MTPDEVKVRFEPWAGSTVAEYEVAMLLARDALPGLRDLLADHVRYLSHLGGGFDHFYWEAACAVDEPSAFDVAVCVLKNDRYIGPWWHAIPWAARAVTDALTPRWHAMERRRCGATTRRGTRCRNGVLPGSTVCRMHS